MASRINFVFFIKIKLGNYLVNIIVHNNNWCSQKKKPEGATEGRMQWHPTPVLLPGKSHGWRNLVGCSPWGL